MRLPLRLALRELRNNRRFTLFFVLNLAIGLGGLVFVQSLRSALETALADRSRLILSADLSVSARRALTIEESGLLAKSVPAETPAHEIVDLFTMAVAGSRSRLVQLRAVPPGYPFYAQMVSERQIALDAGHFAELSARKGIFIDEGLAKELNLRADDSLRIGQAEFVILDILLQDSTSTFSSFALAPRVYLHRDDLPATGLLQPGALQTRTKLFRIPSPNALEETERALEEAFSDPGIQVRTHQESSDRSTRLFRTLSDYLGLVSLTALFLAALGVIFQFRRFFRQRTRSVAILLSLGARRRTATAVYVFELLVLGGSAALIATISASLLLSLVGSFFDRFLPIPLQLRTEWSSVGVATVLGMFGAFLVCWPELRRIETLSPSVLLREDEAPSTRPGKTTLYYIPALLFFYAMAVWVARSWNVGGLFVFTLFLSLGLLSIVGLGMIFVFRRLAQTGPLLLRLSLRHLSRHPSLTLLSVATIGLSVLLTNLVPQIRYGLLEDFSAPRESRPSFFLFDIQEDQAEPLKRFASDRKQELLSLSPTIRSRLMRVNGKGFEKKPEDDRFETREAERESAFRNRGFNLTYRDRLSASETLIAGREFSGAYSADSEKIPEVSVEESFAKRLGWKLGDRLSFDVQGVTVEGEIIGIRKVRWLSFQPNFFVQFQPGVLEDTPKTYLATLPEIAPAIRSEFQNELVRQFPNVSMIDVEKLIGRLMDLVAQMEVALRWMSIFTLLAGGMTLWAMFRLEAHQLRWQLNLLKVLGARRIQIAGLSLLETLLVAGIAAATGIGASFGVSWFLLVRLFDAPWSVDVPMSVLTMLGALLVAALLCTVSTLHVWRERPLRLLSPEA